MIIEAKGIAKRYSRKTGESNYFYAVRETDFVLSEGSLTVLTGRSGSGKTTLMSMLSGLLTPDTGTVTADGQALYEMNDPALSAFRSRHIAVMPQGRAAVDALTVTENILLNARLAGLKEKDVRAKAEAWMEHLGISALKDAFPRELSGGELRRMTLARVLLPEPDVLMCDEPTADLDDENTVLVLETLKNYAASGHAALLVTHETAAPRYADAVYRMDAGTVIKA